MLVQHLRHPLERIDVRPGFWGLEWSCPSTWGYPFFGASPFGSIRQVSPAFNMNQHPLQIVWLRIDVEHLLIFVDVCMCDYVCILWSELPPKWLLLKPLFAGSFATTMEVVVAGLEQKSRRLAHIGPGFKRTWRHIRFVLADESSSACLIFVAFCWYSGQAVEERAAQALEAGAAKHMQEADFEAQCLGYVRRRAISWNL